VGAAIVAIITAPSGTKYRYTAHLNFSLDTDRCTNNIAEYEAMKLGLCKLRTLGVKTCIVKTDSKIVAGQIEKIALQKSSSSYYTSQPCEVLKKRFRGLTTQHIDRNKNDEVGALAKATARGDPLPSDVFYRIMDKPAIIHPDFDPKAVNFIMPEDWRGSIMIYI
jgi:ribonuclease HI